MATALWQNFFNQGVAVSREFFARFKELRPLFILSHGRERRHGHGRFPRNGVTDLLTPDMLRGPLATVFAHARRKAASLHPPGLATQRIAHFDLIPRGVSDRSRFGLVNHRPPQIHHQEERSSLHLRHTFPVDDKTTGQQNAPKHITAPPTPPIVSGTTPPAGRNRNRYSLPHPCTGNGGQRSCDRRMPAGGGS